MFKIIVSVYIASAQLVEVFPHKVLHETEAACVSFLHSEEGYSRVEALLTYLNQEHGKDNYTFTVMCSDE